MNSEILSMPGGRGTRAVPLLGSDLAGVPSKTAAMPGTATAPLSGGGEPGEFEVAVHDVVGHVRQLPIVVPRVLPQHRERLGEADIETFDEHALRLLDQDSGVERCLELSRLTARVN